MSVVRERALVGIPYLVELLEAYERVFIRGVGVKKFVLHKAGHPAKLRDESTEQIDLVHRAHRRGHVAALV